MNYFYGPVYSRRLHLSLGVDLFPKKVCNFNCIYCQLGRTERFTQRRVSYANFREFSSQFKEVVASSPSIDYVTFSGSGEPTLHKDLSRYISAVKKISSGKYPVCVITNSSLLYRKDVRKELLMADLIIPSLDAPSEEIFKKINRPARGVKFERIIEGLVHLRREYKGKIWLEIMLLKGINDSLEAAEGFREIIKHIRPDKVQINLPVRPTTYKVLVPLPSRIEKIRRVLGENTEVVSSSYVTKRKRISSPNNIGKEILKILRVRPVSLEELKYALGENMNVIVKEVDFLKRQRKIIEKISEGKVFFLLKGR